MTTLQPINEPFVDVLLELGGNKGRLIREYTFLLDPVDLRLNQNAQVVAPVALPAERALASSAPAMAALPAAQRAAAGNQLPPERSRAIEEKKSTSYKVKSGDTLTRVAAKFKPEGISLDQMLVALYRANPNGFVGGNMNRMRSGAVLSVPDGNTASSVAPAGASAVVIAQAADFNAYRNQLAGKIARAPAKSSEATKQSAVGKIESKVEETQAGIAESKDKLRLSKADALANSAAGLASEAAVNSRIAADKAVEEANARIQSLEKTVSDLQKLLEIKNKALSEQQLNAQNAPATELAGSGAVTQAVTQAVALPEPMPAPVPVKPKVTAPEPVAKASFFDGFLNDPLLLPGAGLLIAILGAFGIYSNRRRKQRNKFDNSAMGASILQTNSLFGSTGGQSVDTNNSVFNSSFSPSASQLDANEVDPVAEADVYIAYGRDAQAEEILKEALRTQPDRHPVRLKLLEIYSNRKDLRSFEMLASELYGMTKGETDEWHQAARMGAALDPNNPLYAGGALPEEVAAKAVALGAPTLPLEELDPEALLTNSQSDVGDDSELLAFDDIAPPIEPKVDSVKTSEQVPDYLAEAENSISTGLDFDLGEIADAAPEPDVTTQEEADSGSIDFVSGSLAEQMPAPEQSVEQEPEPVVAKSEIAADAVPVPDFPKFDLDEVDFDFMDKTPTDKDEAGQELLTPVAKADTVPVVLPVIEAMPEAKFEPEFESGPDAESDVAGLEFDLSGIDLDFNPAESGRAELDQSDQTLPSDAGFGNMEMSTKLDLAVAYQEIGDKDGARELLDEVMQDGSVAQMEKAKVMLAEMA
ncbi:MAG: FimV/HubP family polar landmark protein [Burkholderiaceae bacterium]